MSLRVCLSRRNLLKSIGIATVILGISLVAQMIVISRINPIVDMVVSTEPTYRCTFTPETQSALDRVKTQSCRSQIENLACLLDQDNYFATWLPHYCPKSEIVSYGCYIGAHPRLLEGAFFELPETNSVSSCIAQCFNLGFKLAGVENGIECHCGNEFSFDEIVANINECQLHKCPANDSEFCGGQWRILVFSTGLPVVNRTFTAPTQSNNSTNKQQSNDVRIVFHFTFAGRYVRQMLRLLKRIYSPKHYYYIHIDKRDEYTFRELSKLESYADNIKLKKERFEPIWTASSRLAMILASVKEMFEVYSDWKWDFFINLSESHFPLFPISDLEAFLSLNRQWNFAEQLYIVGKVFTEKMGLEWTFLECDNYMWRLGQRNFPKNLRIEGNSDWFALNREFLHYVTYSEDDLVKGLTLYHKHAISAMETYFQILLVNSRFCQSFAATNLQFISWGSDGSACQCNKGVDWCGCSPVAITTEWATNLNYTYMLKEHRYLARKFDPTVDLEAINIVERNLLNRTYNGNFNGTIYDDNSYKSFWFNDFHYLDTITKTDPAKLTLLHSLLHICISQTIFHSIEIVRADVEELTILLHENQVFLLLKFNIHTKSGVAQFETNFRYISNEIRTNIDNRIINILVGTNWDVKIKNFRNYANSFGTNSNLGLRVVTNSSEVLQLRSVWYNPSGLEQGTASLNTTNKSNIWLLDWSVNTYLEPGLWTVYLVVDGILTAQIKFPVLPNRKTHNLTYNTGETIGRTVLDLITSFYAILDNCIVDDSVPQETYSIPTCETAPWSSVFPDPKSSFDVDSYPRL